MDIGFLNKMFLDNVDVILYYIWYSLFFLASCLQPYKMKFIV